MDIARELLNQSDNIDMGALASRFGLSEEQADVAVSALLPAVLGGVKKTEQAGGLDQLSSLAGQIGAPALDADGGNAVLGQIFGSKEVSRAVATNASAQTGISDVVLKAMLPVVAGLVAQQVAKRMGGGMLGGLAGGVLGSLLGGGAAQASAASADGGLGGLLGGLLGGAGGAGAQAGGLGGLASMLDADGDGNPLDDILGQVTGQKQ
ncbi:DUF937 domain-containing protein [Sphingomonas cavernae]|uniref:DUF937 domain-containing protein n=1 Tax=Sphingomonas cavernae TaxID=2320861 RepID=A0A418WSB1_9SPHN|nr:DUF937 domain-containing protein [Sphingomonas cavernae]RJF94150.1 DUF937 domain-containing protein [Sphingomonas cavernae]